MNKPSSRKPVATAIGAALVGTLSTADLANAADQPFGLTPLARGYLQVAKNESETKCGANKAASEAKCGGSMSAGQAPSPDKGLSEGTCGEGKCGGNMTTGKAQGQEKNSPEGACGEGKCGARK